jgi:hypothetical protein
VYEFEQSIGGANQALVVLNSYGSGQASMPYAWNTPGYEYSPTGYLSGTGTTGLNTPVSNTGSGTTTTTGNTAAGGTAGNVFNNPINPTSAQSILNALGLGKNIATPPTTSAGTSGGGTIQTTVNLDGRTIARSVQAYTQRANSNGYQYVT